MISIIPNTMAFRGRCSAREFQKCFLSYFKNIKYTSQNFSNYGSLAFLDLFPVLKIRNLSLKHFTACRRAQNGPIYGGIKNVITVFQIRMEICYEKHSICEKLTV